MTRPSRHSNLSPVPPPGSSEARGSAPPLAAVRLTDAAVSVGGRTIWSGVDVTVGNGEFVAVLGPNGVGKSTMIKVLLGLLRLSAGSAQVLGQCPLAAPNEIGYLPQRHSFDPGLRVRGVDMVRLGLNGDRWGVPLPAIGRWRDRRRQASRRVDEVIDTARRAAVHDGRSARSPAASSSDCSSRRPSSAALASCSSMNRWTASTCPTRLPWLRSSPASAGKSR